MEGFSIPRSYLHAVPRAASGPGTSFPAIIFPRTMSRNVFLGMGRDAGKPALHIFMAIKIILLKDKSLLPDILTLSPAAGEVNPDNFSNFRSTLQNKPEDDCR